MVIIMPAELQKDDVSSRHSYPPALDKSSVTLEGSYSTEDTAKFLPPAIQNNLSSVPCKFCNLKSYFNPNPEQWNNLKGDYDLGAGLIATMYDGNPEPKSYAQALRCSDFQTWWRAMCVEFKDMEDKQVWEITPKVSIPKGKKSLDQDGSLLAKSMNATEHAALPKGLVKSLEKAFKIIMFQL
jgi:hypothetical protein